MDLEKLRLLGKLQDEVMDLTGGDALLISFELEEYGIDIHNPFLDPTGRFEVDPLKEYGAENLLNLEAKLKDFEEKMNCKIENITVDQFQMFLEKYFS